MKALPDREKSAQLYDQAVQCFSNAQLDEAERLALDLLSVDPDSADALVMLGAIYTQRKQQALALPFFERAIRLRPHIALYHYNLGVAHEEIAQFASAMRAYQHALRLAPDMPSALHNYADLLRRHGQLSAAEQLFDQLRNLDPHARGLAFKLALLYCRLHRWAEAERYFLQALQETDEPEVVHWQYAHFLLLQKRFREGWASYESRALASVANAVDHYPFAQPLWNGEDLTSKTILIHREQGFGDEVMFGSMLTEVVATAGHVIFVCAPELLRTWQASLPPRVELHAYWGAQPPDWSHPPAPAWLTERAIDYQAPLGRLPLFFRSDIQSFSKPNKYLQIDPQMQALWRDRLQNLPGLAGKFCIGVSWTCHAATYQYDASLRANEKAMPIEFLLPLAQLPNVQLFSLAKPGSASHALPWDHHLQLIDLGAEFFDFAETAALMAEMDLIVTVDTSIAHVAGALGLKTWIALHWDSDWRWGESDSTSYWYPDVQLFRQNKAGDWASVIQAMVRALKTTLPLQKSS